MERGLSRSTRHACGPSLRTVPSLDAAKLLTGTIIAVLGNSPNRKRANTVYENLSTAVVNASTAINDADAFPRRNHPIDCPPPRMPIEGNVHRDG